MVLDCLKLSVFVSVLQCERAVKKQIISLATLTFFSSFAYFGLRKALKSNTQHIERTTRFAINL